MELILGISVDSRRRSATASQQQLTVVGQFNMQSTDAV